MQQADQNRYWRLKNTSPFAPLPPSWFLFASLIPGHKNLPRDWGMCCIGMEPWLTHRLPLSKHRSDATLTIYTKGLIFQPPEFSFSMDLHIVNTCWHISHKCWPNFWNAVISPLLYITKQQPHDRHWHLELLLKPTRYLDTKLSDSIWKFGLMEWNFIWWSNNWINRERIWRKLWFQTMWTKNMENTGVPVYSSSSSL